MVWNKVIRRSFLVRAGLAVPGRLVRGRAVHHAALIEADRIAALDRVCYLYRQRRHGAITGTRSERHFELFDQYERLFAYLDQAGPEAQRYRPAIFDRMVRHLRMVCGIAHRLPAGSQRDFYHRAAQFYRRYRPEDQPAPLGRVERLRRRLLGAATHTGAWSRCARRTNRPAGSAPPRGRAVGPSAGRPGGCGASPTSRSSSRYYRLQRRLPVDQRLARLLGLLGPRLRLQPGRHPPRRGRAGAGRARGVRGPAGGQAGLPAGVPYVRSGSFAYFRALARARWLINNVNFPNYVVKRRRHDARADPPRHAAQGDGARPAVATRPGGGAIGLRRRCCAGATGGTAASRRTRTPPQVWERAYPCRYETLEIGYPRNDRLAIATAEDVDRGAGAARPATRTSASCSTRRPSASTTTRYRPRSTSSGSPTSSAPTTVVLSGRTTSTTATRRSRDGGRGCATSPAIRAWRTCCLAADVLITDYSSVMFDYAVLDRPIVIYAPDWDTYRRTRGRHLRPARRAARRVHRAFAELVTAFRTGAVDGDVAAKARARFRERFCALDDGGAAERAVRHTSASATRRDATTSATSRPRRPPHRRASATSGPHRTDWGEPETDEPEPAPPIPTIIRPAAPRTP